MWEKGLTKMNITELKNKAGKEVSLFGWIHETRDQSKIKFVILRDRTGLLQIVVKPGNKNFETITKIPRESVILVKGKIKKEKQAPSGIELELIDLEVLSEAELQLPIHVVEKGEEAALAKRLDYRWLDLRKPKNLFVFKLWTFMEKAMREFWDKNGFIQIYTPKLMGAPSESGAELFEIEYFGRKAYLAQSPQFYKQMAMASGFEKIFEIGPVFRANPSHTTRHDTEFTMIDMEISYVDSHEDVMKLEEEWLAYLLKRIKQEYGKEIKELYGAKVTVPKIPFPRISFSEAKRLLKEKRHEIDDDLDSQGERMLFEIIKEKYGHEFVFVVDYPTSVRPFYHMRSSKTITKSFDLLWKGLEITTGAQREHRKEILEKQAVEKKLDLELIKDYLNFFSYGCPPHGGFAVSPTRLLMLLLDVKNVREVTFLPRDTQRLNP